MAGKAPSRSPEYNFSSHPLLAQFTTDQQSYIQRHPDEGFNYVATGALVFDTFGGSVPRILLIQRAAGDSMPNQWEVPGGGVDDEDVDILHAAARELWEEAGLQASRIEAMVGEMYLFTSRSGKKIGKVNFLVDAIRNEKGDFDVRLDPEEHQNFVWASEEEVKERRMGDGGMRLEFAADELRETVLKAFKQVRQK